MTIFLGVALFLYYWAHKQVFSRGLLAGVFDHMGQVFQGTISD